MDDNYTDYDLLYAATARCGCGAGLAYPLDHDDAFKLGAWACSTWLKDGGGSTGKHSVLPFAIYEIREETSINNRDGTTRPPGTICLTVGRATCPQCKHKWESEPYSACGLSHHWFSGPCPECGYAVAAGGSWSSSEGRPIEHRFHDVVLAAEDGEATDD